MPQEPVISFWRRLSRRLKDLPARDHRARVVDHEAKADLDRQLVAAVTRRRQRQWPRWDQLRHVTRLFSPREQWLVRGCLGGLVLGLVVLVGNLWFFSLTPAPDFGGEYSEGLVGAPQHLNPVLSAANDVDSDITPLLFCGLLKRDNGEIKTDVASEYHISEDQRTYSVTLRSDAKWHDGQAVTINDVLFTFDLIQDQEVASPLAKAFTGVTAEAVDEQTVKFVLPKPFAPFIQSLTFGLLPEHIWAEIDPANLRLAALNLKPVGCGPFAFASLKRESNGVIKSLTLEANDNYYTGRPYLDSVTFKFYPDLTSLAQAAANKNISAVSYLPLELQTVAKLNSGQGWRLWPLELPQYTAVFFNQDNNSALKELAVRQALAQAIDRAALIAGPLGGQASLADSPILEGMLGYSADHPVINYDQAAVTAALDGANWKAVTPNDFITWQREQEQKAATDAQPLVDRSDEERLAALNGQEYLRMKGGRPLTITLTVVDQAESLAVAKFIQQAWQAVGVQTVINAVAPEQVRREVIKPRRYEALLYSEIVGADPDPYAFWHTSQANDPGLNLARYSNRKVDKLLEDARTMTDAATRQEKYVQAVKLLVADVPAVFLYRPIYPYWINERLQGITSSTIALPSERLSDLARRYLTTKRVWRIGDGQ